MTYITGVGHRSNYTWVITSGLLSEHLDNIEMTIEENVVASRDDTKHHGHQPRRRACPRGKMSLVMGL